MKLGSRVDDVGVPLKLAGAVTAGSGAINEDGFGFIGTPDDVCAAWVFDGVTGINGRNYLPGGSDARWLVERADGHLRRLAAGRAPLADVLAALVAALIADWRTISAGLDLPQDYDPPAACLVLVKRYGDAWQGLRLGDSCLLARYGNGDPHVVSASPNNAFDHWLSRQAAERRAAGVLDMKALLAEFHPQLIAGRAKRNKPHGYSILEASLAALTMPEFIAIGAPSDLLLCSDGYYRAVDHYQLHGDATLIAASGKPGGVDGVLAALRAVEAGDRDCRTFPRFKPADDATALALTLEEPMK